LQHPDKQVNSLQITPDKQYVVAGGNPLIKLFEVNSKNLEPLVTFEGHTGNITSIGFQRDSKWMFSSSDDNTIKIWDFRTPKPQRSYSCKRGVMSVILHPNQGELISGDQSGSIRIWDLAASKCSLELSPEGDAPISSVAITNDATLLAGSNYNGNVYFWKQGNVGAASALGGEDKSGGNADSVFTPVGKVAAHAGYILSSRFSPDLRYFATTSSDKTVKLWNVQSRALLKTLSGHSRWVWDGAFSADSCYFVSASSDCSARLWEISSGEVLRNYTGHSKAITAVALNDSPNIESPPPTLSAPSLSASTK
jgi:G protein beta subunit-like protein